MWTRARPGPVPSWGRSCDERADDAVEEPAGTVTPPLSVEPVSLKDLDTTPQRKKARALAADPAAIREAYARELRHDGDDRPAKDTAEPSCGGVGSLAATGRLGTLLAPMNDGTGRLGLACCVAKGAIKYGSLRCTTIEKLGDYVSRGEAVYEHLGPKSKPHVDFVQRLQAEMKVKNLTRYFYSSMCRCHLDNVTSLLQRVEKKRRLQRVEKKKASKRVRAPAPPQCPICLEDLDDAPALACGHKFHAACVQELAAAAWANGATRTRARGTAVQCPLCRAQSHVQ